MNDENQERDWPEFYSSDSAPVQRRCHMPESIDRWKKMRSSQNRIRRSAALQSSSLNSDHVRPESHSRSRRTNHIPQSQRSSSQAQVLRDSRQARPASSGANPLDVSDRDDLVDEELGHVIVAVDIKDQGTVGCAYYVAENETLFLLGDGRFGGMDAIDTCQSPQMMLLLQ